MKAIFYRFFVLVSFVTLSWGCGPKGNQPNVELIQDMMDQPAVKAQKYDDFFPDHISSRQPPEHTKPVGKNPYPYASNIQLALEKLKNPFEGDLSSEVLLIGQKYYNTNCMVCHGEKAKGDGPIKEKYPLPIPSLLSDKIRSWKDAQIYHVISAGQGVMGAYASHIPENYRWQVVNYIRYLQQKEK
ncbi:MAG: cytochrome c [Bdellovibrionaceae bacterium]|jgi:mono/diheme cytochrome c family protein|nr:cytochrome c [Pseudobdellovibrionaceae bacterium]